MQFPNPELRVRAGIEFLDILKSLPLGGHAMEQHRLDHLTRRLRGQKSRRHVLRSLAGATLSGLALQSRTAISRAEYFCDSSAVVFSDGFESGSLSKWDNPQGLEADQRSVFTGSYAARADSDGQPRFARTGLGGSYRDLYYRIKFNAVQPDEREWVYLMTFRTRSDEPILGFAVLPDGRIVYRNNVMYDPTIKVPGVKSARRVSFGDWHELQARLTIDGRDSRVRVWLDGLAIDEMSNTEDFGSNPIGRIQIGESLSYRTFVVLFDDVTAAEDFCGEFQVD